MNYTLEFEKPVKNLENQIEELKLSAKRPNLDLSSEIANLQEKVNILIKEIYSNLSPWERVLLSRHQNRPHTINYINNLLSDFHEIHGDRAYSTDRSVITGFGYLGTQKVALIGIEKGRSTKEKIQRNFGMPLPEGYRKALRCMKLAATFNIPIITLVDTPGAYPGLEAEERGQAAIIADNIAEIFDIKTPIVSVVIGEGGSGGALGVAIADRVLMMEYSIYTVISPESCASILWADPKHAETAANSLQLGPLKARELGVIDAIINEPPGGAHRDHPRTMKKMRKALESEIKKLMKIDSDKLLEKRFQKFRQMGNFTLNLDKNDTNFKIFKGKSASTNSSTARSKKSDC